MECKSAVKSIQKFLNDDLDMDDLRDFLNHVEECPECKEELTIEILVREGLNSLESGTIFDINHEYQSRILSAEHSLKVREYLKMFYHILTGMVCVGVVSVCLLLAFIYL